MLCFVDKTARSVVQKKKMEETSEVAFNEKQKWMEN